MRVAVLDDYLQVAPDLADWSSLGCEVDFFSERIHPNECAVTLEPYDVIVAMRERTAFPASLIQALPQLKLLVTTGMRNNSIDLAACREKGVVVCGAPGHPSAQGGTAELSWALLLALFKRIPQETFNMQQGLWQTKMPPVIEGKRLGVVGLGNLGQRVARVGLAFGMDVVAWSPNLTDERAAEHGVKRVDKHELFTTSDAISLHMVLSPRSAGIVDATCIDAMKPTAFLVNTSRAGLVDQEALKMALQDQRIGGAGLDVFDEEPLPHDDSWRQVPGVLLTPHLGYASPENFGVFYQNVLANILAWREGSPVRVIS